MQRLLLALGLSKVLLALCFSSAQANVLVVDETGAAGTDHTTLQSAIDAAADGDLILIRPGHYQGTIDGKSLVLQGETADSAWISLLTIENLAANQVAVVRDCKGDRTPSVVRNCAGTVRIEGGSYYGLDCSNAADVVLRGVTLRAYTSLTYDCLGGLDLVDSVVYVYYSIIYGEEGSIMGMGLPYCEPGPGISMKDSTAYLQGSFVTGGDECSSFNCLVTVCPASGVIASGTSSLELVDTGVKAGKRTTCAATPVYVGITPTIRPGNARRISSPSPVLEGQGSHLSFYGDPGDFVYLAMTQDAALARYYAIAGVYHGRLASTVLQAAGTIPASGVLRQTFQVPAFTGPDLMTPFYLQGFFVRPGEKLLGAPTQVYVLDPSY